MPYNNFWNNDYSGMMFGSWMGSWLGFFLLPLVVWSLFWKGWALWKAAKADSKPWFIALLVINTMGILDILYIFIFSQTSRKTSGGHKRK